MKKMLVVLLILAMAMGAFAQELKWSGDVSTGFESSYLESKNENLPSSNDTTKDEDFKFYSYDADNGAPLRAQLVLDYANGNVGAKIKFKLEEPKKLGVNSIFDFAYLSYKFIDIIDLYAGKIDNGVWNTGGDEDGDAGEGLGALVQVAPIGGLTVGAGLYINDDNEINSEYTPGSSSDDGIFYADYTIGAAFDHDLFRVALSARASDTMLRQFWFGVSLKAIDKLGLAVEAFSKNLSDKDIAWQIDEKISYDLGALDVGLTAYQWINQVNSAGYLDGIGTGNSDETVGKYLEGVPAEDTKLGWKFSPWVSYAIGNILPKLSFAIGGTGVDGAAAKADIVYFQVKPSVGFSIAENASITFAYAFDNATLTPDVSGAKDITATQHAVSFDFRIAF
ncbi:hypothetical protein [Treponema primitia]|uniref:hypothetical protein n=1 Tax=Treponema primitia TaxID=88058 RepID=UPI0002554CD4|nr:hypothetical protein [Treponema primitia]